MTHKQVWREANTRLIPLAVFLMVGVVLSSIVGDVRNGSANQRIIGLLGVAIFVASAITFLNVLANTVHRLIAAHRLGAGRATAAQLTLRALGYATIFLIMLELLGVSLGRLLLGGAAIGIILGVAAQQALANFFASLVLIISHPFTVGEHITLRSGALGGEYVGTIVDIGLTHTRLQLTDESMVSLPNSTLLTGAAILVPKRIASVEKEE